MMSNQSEKPGEVRLDGAGAGGRNAWMEALAELDGAAGAAAPKAAPVAPARPSVAPPVVKATAPMKPTPIGDLRDLCERIAKAKATLGAFVTAHPYLIAPNVYRMWEENMQEATVGIERHIKVLEQRPEKGR